MKVNEVKFIDNHSHIMPNIDDGPRSIEESIMIIKQAAKQGIETMYATPHLRLDVSTNDYLSNIKERFAKLKENILHENIDINIKQGYELYVNQNILYATNLSKYCLQDTNCVLVEVNPNSELLWLVDFAHELQVQGIRIILAHPERYELLLNTPKLIDRLDDYGVLYQVNTGSILGYYGRKIYYTAKKLVKSGNIDLIGTDVHYIGHICLEVIKSYNILCRWIGKNHAQDIVYNNARELFSKKEV